MRNKPTLPLMLLVKWTAPLLDFGLLIFIQPGATGAKFVTSAGSSMYFFRQHISLFHHKRRVFARQPLFFATRIALNRNT